MNRERIREMIRGAAAALVMAVVLCAGGAALIGNEVIGEKWMRYLAAAILTGSGFAGGISCFDAAAAVLSGVVVWLVLTAAGACTEHLSAAGAGASLLAILGGCAAAVLLKIQHRASGRARGKRRIVKVNKKLH